MVIGGKMHFMPDSARQSVQAHENLYSRRNRLASFVLLYIHRLENVYGRNLR